MGNDGTIGFTWASGITYAPPQWWAVDVGTPKVLGRLRINQYDPGDGGGIKTALVQGSNDGSGWTTVYNLNVPDVPQTWFDYTVSPPSAAYRYFRVYITSNYRSDGYCGFNEIEMYEY